MNNIDIIDLVPPWQKNCLRTNRYFDDMAVVVFEEGNIATAVAKAQAVIEETNGKRGVAIIVPQVTANDLSNDLQFGPMLLKLSFIVIENVELNTDDHGTGQSARKVARKIRDVMKTQNYFGVVSNLRTATPCIEPIAVKDLDERFVLYGVNFECLEVGQEQMIAVQVPVIALGQTPPQFILTCATPGAAIWYTLDDTFPFNGTVDAYPGSTAVQYVPGTPVNIPVGGCILSARAYMDGDNYVSSGINRATLVN